MAAEPAGAARPSAAHSGEDSARTQLDRVRRNRRTRQWAAALTLVLAVVTVVSAVSPPLRGRLQVLLEVLPFVALHAAATTTVFAGCALAGMARGLRSGHRVAWTATLVLLLVSAALHLIKGLDVEEGLLSAALAAWLALRRDAFTVTPTTAQTRRALVAASGAATAAVLVATALALTLGRHHHPHPGETVRATAERLGGSTRLPLPELSPVATPLLTAVGLGVLTGSLWLLLSPRWARARTPAQHRADRERARTLVDHRGGGTLDYFALRDDKDWFFTGDAVVPYAERGGVCLVSPDPVGPPGSDTRRGPTSWTSPIGRDGRWLWSVRPPTGCRCTSTSGCAPPTSATRRSST